MHKTRDDAERVLIQETREDSVDELRASGMIEGVLDGDLRNTLRRCRADLRALDARIDAERDERIASALERVADALGADRE